jgi:hypothetical protein
MSGTTTTTNHRAATYARYIAATEYGSQIFSGERGEFGIYKFADPHRQMTYEHHETCFKKMRGLKTAYDKQEFLRRIRADMKREYLTRKKQMKRLQMDAAVDFRNAENELQEHFSTEAADHPYIQGVDINAPLISQIRLPNDQVLDLKAFDEKGEFAKVRQNHADLLADQQESIRLFEQEEQRQSQYYSIQQGWIAREYGQRRPDEQPRGGDGVGEEEIKTENHWECHDANCSTCGRDDDNDSYKGDEVDVQHGRAFTWAELVAGGEKQEEQPEEEPQGRYGDGGFCGCGDEDCSDCFSYVGDKNDDQRSYDSEYDGIFPDYPREYNWERECREAEEAAAAAAAAEAAEQQRWEENTRNSDGETWDEEARADEAEHRREVAQMRLNDDMTYACDDHPDVLQLEVVEVTEPKERITASAASTGGISAQKKAAAGAAKKAAKARQAKQELKKAKFVPIKITMNTNRVPVSKEGGDAEEEQTTTLLYQGKAQVNLPKKNLQNASREDKRRHIAKWRRIEAAEKHASARGTRIANIREPSAWYNCGGSDNEYNGYEH